MPARKKQKVLSLAKLLGKKKSNAEYHVDDAAKRREHIRNRAARDRLIRNQAMAYTGPLSADSETDLKYHALAIEFVNNGMDAAKAYSAVFGVPLRNARAPAKRIFASETMKTKVMLIMLGENGGLAENLPKDGYIEQLALLADANVLDFMDDEGNWFNVRELRERPRWQQQQLKKVAVQNSVVPVALRDENGAHIRNEEAGGRHYVVEVLQQSVQLEVYDRQKSLDLLGRAMNWITTNKDGGIDVYIAGDMMVQAERRRERLSKDDIEGKAVRIAAD